MTFIQKIFAISIKAGNVVARSMIRVVLYFNIDLYMRLYTQHLAYCGVRMQGIPKFISNDVYFDGSDYSLISIGDNIVISREVMFLTHDYSLTAGLAALGQQKRRGQGEVYVLRPIAVGNDCFIGARVSILPGANIGDNVVIGAGSVVVGHIPSNSVAAGNPCRVVGQTNSWARDKIEKGGFLTEGAEAPIGTPPPYAASAKCVSSQVASVDQQYGS